MCNNKNVLLLICIYLILNSSQIFSQEQFLLTEDEMAGYKLERQSVFYWDIGKESNHEIIRQNWIDEESSDNQPFLIDYAEFNTAIEAICGTAFSSGSHAAPFFWGSINSTIIGDGSWVPYENEGMYFVRGNIGIMVFTPFPSKDDQIRLELIAYKVLNKIDENLSVDVLSLEELAKQKQISSNDYEKMTELVVNSETMDDFLISTTWDSKWLPDSNDFVMGKRIEWKKGQEALIGIDICQFDSIEKAKRAAEIRSQHAYCPTFNLDSLVSLEKIITEWQNRTKFGNENKLFSVVSSKNNLSVHIYQFDSTKINTDFTYSIIEKLAEQISNF